MSRCCGRFRQLPAVLKRGRVCNVVFTAQFGHRHGHLRQRDEPYGDVDIIGRRPAMDIRDCGASRGLQAQVQLAGRRDGGGDGGADGREPEPDCNGAEISRHEGTQGDVARHNRSGR